MDIASLRDSAGAGHSVCLPAGCAAPAHRPGTGVAGRPAGALDRSGGSPEAARRNGARLLRCRTRCLKSAATVSRPLCSIICWTASSNAASPRINWVCWLNGSTRSPRCPTANGITSQGRAVAKLSAVPQTAPSPDRTVWLARLTQLREQLSTGKTGPTVEQILDEDRGGVQRDHGPTLPPRAADYHSHV
jgi:antitoxin (DNA-binding transcriptional repressor) of toxin-antitoxin stability system